MPNRKKENKAVTQTSNLIDASLGSKTPKSDVPNAMKLTIAEGPNVPV
jgi:hypothetical protein